MRLFQRTGSNNWWITFSIGGKRFRESTGTTVKRKAEAVLAKREVEIFEGRHFPDKKQNTLTMAKLQDLWLKHAKHKRSLKNDERRFKTAVEHFGPNCLIATITKRDIEKFRDKLVDTKTRKKKKMAPATVNRHLALLRAAFRYVEDEYLHRNPMKGVKFLPERNQRERECEPDEYKRLLEAAAPELRLAIVLAYEEGLRRTEVCRALRTDVNLKRRKIHIPAGSAKNDTPRTLPLTKKAIGEIESYPTCLDGTLVNITPDKVTRTFTKLCVDLEIKGLVFHDLRGTAITRLARQGANLAELQKFSGHKSVQALMKYLKRGDKRLRELIDKMEGSADG